MKVSQFMPLTTDKRNFYIFAPAFKATNNN